MPTNRSIRRTSAAASAAAAILALSAGSASALPPLQPPGGGQGPLNSAPTAKLVASPKVALVSHQLQVQAKKLDLSDVLAQDGDVVKFDASGSSDPEGSALTYDWDLDGNGTYELLGKDPKQSKRYFSTGTVTVKVRVHDADGAADTASEQIIVHAAPQAKLTSDIATPLVGQSVKFDSGASTGDPAIVKREWDLDGDGTFETNTGTGGTAGASYQAPGPRTIRLRVTDTYGVTSVASIIEHVNQLPTAAFSSGAAVAGQAVRFDGSASSDDSAITKYEWDLDGDGTFETDTLAAPSVSKVYPTPGPATVRLRVTDDLGGTSVVSHTLDVQPVATGKTLGTGGTPGTGHGAPKLGLSKTKLRLAKSGRVTVKLTSLLGDGDVKGTLKLRTRGKHGKTLVTRSFSITGGSPKLIGLLLPAVQRASIRRGKLLKANAVITVNDAAGVSHTSTLGILIGL